MRIIVVSNRLPITFVKNKNQIEAKQSVGGLATGINSFLEKFAVKAKLDYLWVGWPGKKITPQYSKFFKNSKLYPIPIDNKLMQKFYKGFCNKILWPLFLYLIPHSTYEEEEWEFYQQINQKFCEHLVKIIKPDDIIWIHDYHLLLLPRLIREYFPSIAITFFLHIPFPPFELFRFLPNQCRTALLQGLLGADLIGFHNYEYSQHFLRCVSRIVGYETNFDYINIDKRLVKVGCYPMSIDYSHFNRTARKTHKHTESNFHRQYNHCKIIISIDRLDYSKGIINKLDAFETFLEKYKTWQKKIILLLIVAPSRESVKEYIRVRKSIDEHVGHINGKYGSINWTPIIYQYKAFNIDELIPLYSISEIALITPLRDGMNLIAKEYIASRFDKKGSLILSETAGAANELIEALIVNPNSKEEIATAIYLALTMPEAEKISRMQTMQKRIKKHNVVRWGKEIINDVIFLKKYNQPQSNLVVCRDKTSILRKYKNSDHRLILLDYDGTLVPFANHPDLAKPSQELIQLLTALAQDKNNQVVIISGRNKDSLEAWLKEPDINLIAEHGGWVRTNSGWDAALPNHNPMFWEADLLKIFKSYTEKLPGSLVEKKFFSFAWHYRAAEPQKSAHLAKELLDQIRLLLLNTNLKVISGNQTIEIKPKHIGKDIAVQNILRSQKFDFILAIGDDVTDEDMFSALPSKAITIKVGNSRSFAKYKLSQQSEVIDFLKGFLSKGINTNHL